MSDDNYYSDEAHDFATLPAKVEKKVSGHWEKFYSSVDEGDFPAAEAEALKAWEALPEPKLQWDYYANVIPMDLVTFYRNWGDFGKALAWLGIARETYGPGPNVSVEFVAATVAYESGDFDAAFQEFNRQYETFGKRAFEGEDPKYLAFTMKRRRQS
jgi:hypothetical protein